MGECGNDEFDIRELGTILGVWAHPDDEAYLSAGLMAMAVDVGSRVVCVTATRGELGSMDLERWPVATLADVRTRELAVSLELLGVSEHVWLDYPDGGCADVPADEAVDRLVTLIDDVEPDTFFTFGPDGMTGHDDHRTVSEWTSAAFARTAKPGARLFHATKTDTFDDRFATTSGHRRAFGDAGSPRTPEHETAIACRLTDAFVDVKVAALRAQVSQVDVLRAEMGHDLYREWVAHEWFCLAATR
jgi:LmbE family N-acetylglucosaminyl deacetylase